MHEYSLACEIFDHVMTTAQANNAVAVNSISLGVGRLTHVNPDQLLFCLEALSRDTIASEAIITVKFISPAIICECGFRGTADDLFDEEKRDVPTDLYVYIDIHCPVCGIPLQIDGGRELIIQTIDIKK